MAENYVSLEDYIRKRLDLPKTETDIIYGGIAQLATIETLAHTKRREKQELSEVVENISFLGLPTRFYQFTSTFLMDSVYGVILSHFELRGFIQTRNFLPSVDSGGGGFVPEKKHFIMEKGEERYRIEISHSDMPGLDEFRVRTMGVEVRKVYSFF